MGGSHSREDLETSESEEEESSEEEHYEEAQGEDHHTPSSSSPKTKSSPETPDSSLQQIDAKLEDLKLKYPFQKNSVKLYLHVGGSTPNAKWITVEKLTTYSFFKSPQTDDSDGEDGDEGWWIFKVGSKVQVKVGTEMLAKMYGDQCRVDFVFQGVWSMNFFNGEDYRTFVSKYQECLFENTYGVEATDDNTINIYGKDFIGWAKPEVADDSVWEDADDGGGKSGDCVWATPARVRATQNLMGEFEEVVREGGRGGIQSLALGALENSFLVGDSGLQVVKNFSHGIEGKGFYVKFNNNESSRFTSSQFNHSISTPKKALLMKAETNMLLMNSANRGDLHSTGLHQFDIETGRIVSEWKFGKDGVDITMRDITNDSKGAQLDPSESTFLGLDDNRLCRWDMRDRKGMVQDLATASAPVLDWVQGHQFSRGANFQCFATTGDGSVVVGSLDGKIRLYSKTSMRQAKTAFPGLGSPITHVDVTYDGKWILGTTNTYLILVSTMFTDKDGNIKNGFNGRMGNRISAPRLLKLTPLDSHLAGENSKFHGGQFSWVTENGRQERHLVATVGKFSVIWNFQQVKNNKHECYENQEGLKSCYCYKTVPKEESIVDSRFMHDNFAISDLPEAPLVVATPMKFSSFSISSKQ